MSVDRLFIDDVMASLLAAEDRVESLEGIIDHLLCVSMKTSVFTSGGSSH